MQGLNVIIYGPLGRDIDDLSSVCRETKIIGQVSQSHTVAHAIKRLNSSTRVHVALIFLTNSPVEIKQFLNMAGETTSGHGCCLLGVGMPGSEEMQIVSKPFRGFLDFPFGLDSSRELCALIHQARKELENLPIVQWLDQVARKIITHIDVVVELKRAGYGAGLGTTELDSMTERLRQLNPRLLPNWERILLDICSSEDLSPATIDSPPYRGASSRVLRRFEAKVVEAVEAKRGVKTVERPKTHNDQRPDFDKQESSAKKSTRRKNL